MHRGIGGASLLTWERLLQRGPRAILLPLVDLALRLVVAFFVSLVVYLILYSYLLPKALVREPVFFDYMAKPNPTARISLVSLEKQWYYSNLKKSGGELGAGKGDVVPQQDSKRFLYPGYRYSIDLTFNLAKSQRNLDLGKFMVYLTMVDSTGDSIAKSARPVAIPYQSLPSLVLDSITKYPLRLFGLYQIEEASSVCVPIMNDYREPLAARSSTETVELILSTEVVDICDVFLTIMPVLGGITFYMHYYPRASFFFGVTLIMGIQISTYLVYFVVSFIYQYLSTVNNFIDDERQDMDMDEGGFIRGVVGDGAALEVEGGRGSRENPADIDDGSDRESLVSSTWRSRNSIDRGEDDSESEISEHERQQPSPSLLRRRASQNRPEN